MGWKSFISKPRKKEFQQDLKQKTLEEMRKRDGQFKENWQHWHDEHSEE